MLGQTTMNAAWPSPLAHVGPRERLVTVGLESLSDTELIALVLGTGGRGESVLALSSRILQELGGLHGLSRVGPGELSSCAGIGPSKAARLVACFELGRRAASQPMAKGAPIRSSHDIVAALTPLLAHSDVERFLAIPADARNRPIGRIELAKGGLHACPVSPADVFRSLLRAAASAVVFIHNHPSGDPSPSPEDIALTDRLERAGELVGVRVLDHVILAREGSFSFADAGLLGAGERR